MHKLQRFVLFLITLNNNTARIVIFNRPCLPVMDAGEKLFFVFTKDFFYDFCIAKNSSLSSIPKLNVPAIQKN